MTPSRRPKRGQASKLTQSRLTDAFDCFGEGFVLWDADDRLELCNRKYREFFAVSADLMVRGGSFEEILRGAVARGQYPAAKADPEGWIKVVLERRLEATGSLSCSSPTAGCTSPIVAPPTAASSASSATSPSASSTRRSCASARPGCAR